MIFARTTSAAETQALAASMVELLQSQDLVLLSGEMGAGKTTFTQGLGRALGITDPITSPTFVLMRTYEADLRLYHVDIYRIEHLQEVIDLGLLELLDEGGIALVEWGEIALPVLPRDYLEVRLLVDPEDDECRQVQVRGIGSTWAMREKALSDVLSRWSVDEGGRS